MMAYLMMERVAISRLTLNSKCCLLLQTKLLGNGTRFSDDSTKKHNFYETLGIPRTSTLTEIKKAYYDLTLKYHPDRNENCKDAAVKFRQVTEAYEILGSYRLRKQYDRGEPVSPTMKTVKYTGHKAKYQEFYDSRSIKKNDDRAKEIDNLTTFAAKKIAVTEAEKQEEYFKSTEAAQVSICMMFFAVFIALKLIR